MANWLCNYNEDMYRKRYAKYEEQCVDLLLGYYKFGRVLRQKMLQDYKCCYGVWTLTFESFNRVIPDFPFQLVLSHSMNVAIAHPLSKLFGNFAALPLLAEYSAARYSLAKDAQFALVIRWPYFRGALVLHELISKDIVGPKFEFPATDDCKALTLQPLGNFLAQLEWGPPSSYENEPKDEKI
jgi:hypothetical protein